MRVKPLHPYPALLLYDDNERYVIISDLHIGFEEQYTKKGITIDDNYIYDMVEELKIINNTVKPNEFILLGDIKDSIAKINKNEWRLVPEFLECLKEVNDITIIPGNHDNNIDSLTPAGINITSPQGLVIDDTLLIHGHTIPKYLNVKRIVMGHLHPKIVKEGSVLNGERVWIFVRIDKSIFAENGVLDIIILPTFNKYLNSNRRYDNTIAPLLKRVNEKILDCLIVTLDGSIVGNKDMLNHLI
ncbi:MAG: phosphoesterase [Candidatus Nitrosocaldaceae archaeon]|nr:MAG: phosphoesterase [Candidatus Nitrosocaldaceae archaeon]GIU72471.1 MAG: phosphoesterase [Candidatus Nitrosocaldaceae archaeon]